ncbi:uncharacterized protein Z518_04944 [Rhinocladiella mackenziei CBS 650.93]|uniref:Uncharacterized protein n=1 Tax=Rhinocladiella mackenziei CBS 650.93 TaxID=1442369 RepID=A0A0D2H920_9EURO|nr:uncharacterized protein Z518_04944 [Rhinocladiella mackenziei CBS 650.93]KIX06968.1 hypothetical protein Z518_04944 [Rhinocladiella mackenziei CBS 650.93]
MAYIFSGVWKEYLQGTTRHHLTITDSVAFVILTFLALLISYAITSIWSAQYLYLRELLPPQPASLRELRNSDDSGYGRVFSDLIFAMWHERRRQQHWSSLLLVWLISTLFLLASPGIPIRAALGLTYETEEVPIVRSSGSICEFLTPSERSAATLRNANMTLAASEYFQGCYLEHSPVSCQSNLAQDRLPWNSSDVECPFSPEACANSTTAEIPTNIRLETPFISMDEQCINSRSKLRLKKAMTCTVLDFERFRASPRPELQDVAFTLIFGAHEVYEYDVRNLSGISPGYRLSTIPQMTSEPLDLRLRMPNGFVTVILLQAPDVYFPQPVDDLMFSAHQENLFAASGLRWSADNLINVAACVDEFILCNNGTGACGPWESPEALAPNPGGAIDTDEDDIAWSILQYVLSLTSIHYTINGRGASALLVQRSISSQNQEKISERQWQEELNGWFGISLAKLQLNILSIAHPTPFLSKDGFVPFPSDSTSHQLCQMIKSREGGYTNIHWSGFIATVVIIFVAILICEGLKLWKKRSRISIPSLQQQSTLSLMANPPQLGSKSNFSVPLNAVTGQQQGASSSISLTQTAPVSSTTSAQTNLVSSPSTSPTMPQSAINPTASPVPTAPTTTVGPNTIQPATASTST